MDVEITLEGKLNGCEVALSLEKAVSYTHLSPLLPPVGVWAVSQSQCAVQPLSPATDRRLGEPLPHQLSNRTRAHLSADCSFDHCIICLLYTSRCV